MTRVPFIYLKTKPNPKNDSRPLYLPRSIAEEQSARTSRYENSDAPLERHIRAIALEFQLPESAVAAKIAKAQELMVAKGVNTSLDEIAKGVESLAPDANQLGVSLDEILAAVVTMVKP